MLSPVAQQRRGFTVSPLPDGSSLAGNVFDEALTDNTITPIPDQVVFRLDWPAWLATLAVASACHTPCPGGIILALPIAV